MGGLTGVLDVGAFVMGRSLQACRIWSGGGVVQGLGLWVE